MKFKLKDLYRLRTVVRSLITRAEALELTHLSYLLQLAHLELDQRIRPVHGERRSLRSGVEDADSER